MIDQLNRLLRTRVDITLLCNGNFARTTGYLYIDDDDSEFYIVCLVANTIPLARFNVNNVTGVNGYRIAVQV